MAITCSDDDDEDVISMYIGVYMYMYIAVWESCALVGSEGFLAVAFLRVQETKKQL